MAQRRATGQSLTEYGLVLMLITVVCITALQLLGGNLSQMMNAMATSIGNALNG